MLASAEHNGVVLSSLTGFCGTAASLTTRSAANTLGVHLAMRCAKLIAACPSDAQAADARALMWRLFQMMGAVLLEGATDVRALSYGLMASVLAMWRLFQMMGAVLLEGAHHLE